MKNLIYISTFFILFSLNSVLQAKTISVTSPDDDGYGTFRYAINKASESKKPVTIKVKTNKTIIIGNSLDYTGLQPLTIIGSGQVVRGNNVDILKISNGADLSISDLSFFGIGSFNIKRKGTGYGMYNVDAKAGKGIFVDVRDDQTGTININLKNVRVEGVANHGIHISDCNLADKCGSGSGGAGEGSSASINVVLDNVTIFDAGNGKFDADGFRVDERGDGDINFTALNSKFLYVGADGVELDEGQKGNVVANVTNSTFSNNGAYCDPKLLKAYMPAEDEGEFEDNQRAKNSIPSKIKGSPDDGCFEREVELYPSGFVKEFEFGIDLDDGFDIDEAGQGNLVVNIDRSRIVGNLDEGLDFDEENNGDMFLQIKNTVAMNNTDDGIKNSENDGGSIIALFEGINSIDNGGKGIVVEEEDTGNIQGFVQSTFTRGNDDGDKTGIEAVQEDDGMGTLKIVSSTIVEGFDLEGVELK